MGPNAKSSRARTDCKENIGAGRSIHVAINDGTGAVLQRRVTAISRRLRNCAKLGKIAAKMRQCAKLART